MPVSVVSLVLLVVLPISTPTAFAQNTVSLPFSSLGNAECFLYQVPVFNTGVGIHANQCNTRCTTSSILLQFSTSGDSSSAQQQPQCSCQDSSASMVQDILFFGQVVDCSSQAGCKQLTGGGMTCDVDKIQKLTLTTPYHFTMIYYEKTANSNLSFQSAANASVDVGVASASPAVSSTTTSQQSSVSPAVSSTTTSPQVSVSSSSIPPPSITTTHISSSSNSSSSFDATSTPAAASNHQMLIILASCLSAAALLILCIILYLKQTRWKRKAQNDAKKSQKLLLQISSVQGIPKRSPQILIPKNSTRSSIALSPLASAIDCWAASSANTGDKQQPPTLVLPPPHPPLPAVQSTSSPLRTAPAMALPTLPPMPPMRYSSNQNTSSVASSSSYSLFSSLSFSSLPRRSATDHARYPSQQRGFSSLRIPQITRASSLGRKRPIDSDFSINSEFSWSKLPVFEATFTLGRGVETNKKFDSVSSISSDSLSESDSSFK